MRMLVETRKYKQYFTEVNRLYFEEDVLVARIASQLPVSQPTIYRWIDIFGAGTPRRPRQRDHEERAALPYRAAFLAGGPRNHRRERGVLQHVAPPHAHRESLSLRNGAGHRPTGETVEELVRGGQPASAKCPAGWRPPNGLYASEPSTGKRSPHALVNPKAV